MSRFTVLIISQGNEELLRKCIDSVRPNLADGELLIVGNGAPVPASCREGARIIESTERLTPGAARNLGLQHITTEWVFFCGEATSVRASSWKFLAEFLENPKVDGVGGPLRGKSAMSIALSSPFCTGTTFSRYRGLGGKAVLADEEKLTIQNLWLRRSALDAHRFPEDYLHGEELLLLQELRRQGGQFLYHPKLVSFYQSQEGVRDFFWEGFYRSRLMKLSLSVGQEAFWLPAVFVLLQLALFLHPASFLALAELYWGIILFVSLGLCVRERRIWLFPYVAILHYIIVLFYGLGFLVERFKFFPSKGR